MKLGSLTFEIDPAVHTSSPLEMNTLNPWVSSLPFHSSVSLGSIVDTNSYFQCTATGSPTIYGVIEQNLSNHFSKSWSSCIPFSELEELIMHYEKKYGLRSLDFLALWKEGRFEDNPETNNWANVALFLERS